MKEIWRQFQTLKQSFENAIDSQEKKKILLSIQDEVEPNMKVLSLRDQQYYKQEINALKNQLTQTRLFAFPIEKEIKENGNQTGNESTKRDLLCGKFMRDQATSNIDVSTADISINLADDKSWNIHDLSYRTIFVEVELPMLVLKNCRHLKICASSSNAISGSFRIEDCEEVQIRNLSCSQLRIRNCTKLTFTDCNFFNGGALESSHEIRFVNCTNDEKISNFSSPFGKI